jgi:hypothetical protein
MIRSPLRRRTVRTSVAAFAAAVSLLDARGALVAQDSAPASRAASRPAENRLAAERSLYLRLHATNPVDWHPFGAEAFERARREDKPVFLSIGYSSCHWCHVMARESFEDETIAAFLNERFVCVKVDREERPDVDRVYIDACLRLNGAAGWPLTAFLAPDRRPFYVATYLPPDDRFGEPGLLSVARSVARLWSDRRADLVDAGAIYAEAFSLRHLPTPALKALVAELERKTFDAVLAAASRPATAEAESESAAEPEESDVLRARLERARAALAERDARRSRSRRPSNGCVRWRTSRSAASAFSRSFPRSRAFSCSFAPPRAPKGTPPKTRAPWSSANSTPCAGAGSAITSAAAFIATP